jgi:hypothetical protein
MRKIVAVMLLVVTCAYADVPNEVTYQGRLREYDQPVSGTRTMNFRIYGSASGTGFLWESGNVDIVVTTGTFNYMMRPDVDWRVKDCWIETVVSGKTLTPREKITSQVFALHSRTSEDISKTDGNNINFTIGNTPKAILSSNGEFKSLVNGTTFYMVPRGAIIMWSGAITDIPGGWVLCDGTNGTADLRDRFIMGAGGEGDKGQGIITSNSRIISSQQLPPHSHNCNSVNVDHYHTIGSSGDHSHSAVIGVRSGGDWSSGGSGTINYGQVNGNGSHTHKSECATTEEGCSSQNHNHGVNDAGQTRGAEIDFRPAYYRLAFIMKL